MTKKLFEAYKNGTWKPYNRYYIESFKPILIPRHKLYSSRSKEYWQEEIVSTMIPVNDTENVTITFNGDIITYSINHFGTFIDENTRKVYPELLPPYTVSVDYRNIKAFH